MKLIEFLNTAKEDEYIYLGAVSGFLWIGFPGEIIAKLSDLDEHYVSRTNSHINRNERYIGYKKTQIHRVEDDIRRGYCVERLEKVKRGLEKELAKLERRKARNISILETRTPFSEREVKDVYHKHLVEPAGTVVVIEGEEYGDYWTLDEVLNGEGVCEPIEEELKSDEEREG